MPTLTTHKPAPDFILRDLTGHPHTLSHYRGRITILNFWSADCPWSERVDAALREYHTHWQHPVNWISIAPNANETPGELARVSRERRLPLVLHDPQREIAERYGAEATPHLFVLDAEGFLRYQGAFDNVTFRQKTPTRPYLKDAVDALFASRLPNPAETPAYGCAIVHHP
jgi:peroxiredoxin